MRKIYSSLLMLAMMMVSMVAKAQYTVTIDSDPIEDWVAGQVSFPATEIASALGLSDAAALEALVKNPNENGDLQGGNVYLKLSDGSKSNDYTGNTNEFWMNLAGVPQAYGDEGTSWFVGLEFEAAGSDKDSGESWEDRINVYVGQMPKVFKKIYEASALKCVLYLVNGDKEVSFDVTQNVTAAEKTEVPEPTKQLSALTIVKDYTLELPFTLGKQYEGKTYTATLDGVYDALGTSAAEFDAAAADMTFTQVVVADTVYNEQGENTGEVTYRWVDDLKTPEEGADGGWFGRYSQYDEATGEEVTFPMNAPLTWATGANTFYVQGITLAEGVYSITSGQYPNTLKEGDEDFAYLYLIYGSKAARIKVVTKVTKPEEIDPDAYVIVGSQDVAITSPANDSYETKNFSIDMAAVLEALACEADDITDFYVWTAEGTLTDDHTTGEKGYYLTAEGKHGSWNDKAPVYINPVSLPDGTFAIGQYAGIFLDITEDLLWTTQLIFQNGNNLYAINVNYTVKAPGGEEEEPAEYECVGTESLAIQIVPNNEGVYEWGTKSELDLAYIESKIGTQDFVLYTDKYVEGKDGAEGKLEMNKKYTCTPNPGFWYGRTTYENTEHQVVVDNAGWGTNSFGLTYASGKITWYQYPGQSSVGETWNANLYLMNEETGKYLTYYLYVAYVDEVGPELEVVYKEENAETVTDASYDSDGYVIYNIDKEKLYEALGLDDETIEAATFSFAKSNTMFVNVEPGDDALLTADGYMTDDETKAVATAHFYTEDGSLQIQIDPMDIAFEKSDDSQLTIHFAVNYDGKRALYAVTFYSEDSAVAINSMNTQKAAATGIYSISGARLAAPQKGLNIIRKADGNVSKVFVK